MNLDDYRITDNCIPKFNESTFDKVDFFNVVDEILHEIVPADDVKGNIYTEKDDFDEENIEFIVKAHLEFILYNCEVAEKKFKSIANKLSNKIIETFNLSKNDVDCFKYKGQSNYVKDLAAYDVKLEFTVTYKYD